jgi:RNA polymerase sigma-70 factor (ECF subfamily)
MTQEKMLEVDGVRRAAQLGRARWPALHLGEDAFARHIEGLGVPDHLILQRAEDLYLAAACAAGEPAALQALEDEYLNDVGVYVAGRVRATPAFLDELRQSVRLRLLVESPPRITVYDGRGALRGFVRVMTLRIALDLLDADARQPRPLEPSQIARHFSPQPAPENDLARQQHGPLVQQALEQALATLTPREKAVLRFHFVEALNIEAIGTIYRVHRATVARWLVDIRQRLLRAVEERLAVDLRMSPSEFRSLVGLVQDELRISFSRVLG